MDALLQDVRYAMRGLARSPGFTAAALLTLAIGTGANATVFSLVNAMLLRPAPIVREPSSLYSIFTSDFSSGPYGTSSYPDFLSLRDEASAFSELAAFAESAAVVRNGEATERVRALAVSGEFFTLLGLQSAHGRLLTPSDFETSAAPAMVISHHLWKRMFGADPAVLGRSLAINGQLSSIVGVAPEGFDGLNLGVAVDIWTPLVVRASDPASRGNRGLSIVGRLREGFSVVSAQAQLDTIAASLARAYPATNMGTLGSPDRPRPIVALRHSRMHPRFRGMIAMVSAVLMSAVGLVLVVACANVAGLLLSRGAARSREITTRLALGASRLRVIRQLLTESVLLGIAGGAFGVLFALWTSDVLPSFFPTEQARILDAGVDMRVLAFTALISVVAGTVFGIIPALKVLRGTERLLHTDTGRSSEARTGFMRAGLVLSQVALTFVLLVACGLFVRSVSNALSADLGFGARNAVLANLEIPTGELTAQQGALYFEQVLDRVRALPGVEAASLVRTVSLSSGSRRVFGLEGYEPRPGEDMELNINVADERYFDTMRIPILEGRAFDRRDTAASTNVAIVNDVLADRYFGGRAIGRRIQERRGTILQVVGVVRGVKHLTVQDPPVPVVFYPLSQSYLPRMTLVARTAGDPGILTDTIRNAAQEVNRSVAVFRVMTLESHISEALGAERLTATLVTTSGAMALALAIVGLYGVIAYGVIQRRKEIGVRIALGARPIDVVRLVVREGVVVAFCGIGAGVIAALAATRLIATLLYGVDPWDTATFIGAAAVLSLIAALAAWAPAQRAVRLDPVAALRQE
jgi:putative ABC transport system permease protein